MTEINEISLKQISELQGMNFLIPSYQRGYRWTLRQVRELLNDIQEFTDSRSPGQEEQFYCLQPLIFRKNNGKCELIDGQQRITTIYIILYYIGSEIFSKTNPLFTIDLEVRTNSLKFLNNLTDSEENLPEETDNIDFFHIRNAYRAVKEWFEGHTSPPQLLATELYPVLLKHVKFIWYQINDGSDPRSIFTRINVGKIPLTNAELIKALFLRHKENEISPSKEVLFRQLRIASEWDRMEQKLQDNKFWYFLNREHHEPANRIEFIFDLMADKPTASEDDYFTFHKFHTLFNDAEVQSAPEGESTEQSIWKKVKKCFQTFEEWYNEPDLFHMIGFLITSGKNIKDIRSKADKSNKSAFRKYLRNEISKQVKLSEDVAMLDYMTNNPGNKIQKVLLLLNIDTILRNKESDIRFPFHHYKGNGKKKRKWSLEHIHARNSKGLDTPDKRKNWLQETKDSFMAYDRPENDKGEKINLPEILDRITAVLEEKSLEKEVFEQLQDQIFQAFGAPDLNTINNLTLLSAVDNSILSNSIFPIKRDKIRELERKGSFIPLATRNVFMKYYSEKPTHLHYWGDNDRRDYLKAIRETLKRYQA